MNIDFQKLFYRATPLLCCFVLLLGLFPVSASASAYNVDELAWTINETDTTYEIVMNPDIISLFKLESTGVGYYSVYEQLDGDSMINYSGNGFVLSPFGSMLYAPDDTAMEAYGDCVYTSSLPDYTKLTVTCVIYFGEDEYGSPEAVPVSDTFFFEFGANECFTEADYNPDNPEGGYYVTGTAESLGKPSVNYVSLEVGDSYYDGIQLTFETTFDKSYEYITYAMGVMFSSAIFAYSFDWSSSLIFTKDAVASDPDNPWCQLIYERLGIMHEENLSWFERIWKAITDGFNAVLDAIGNIIGISAEDKQAAEDFKNDAIDKSEKLEGAVDAMGSVNKPPADQVQAGMDNFLPSDGGNYVSQTMNVIVGYPLVAEQLSIVVIIMFASFVLFGKKEA